MQAFVFLQDAFEKANLPRQHNLTYYDDDLLTLLFFVLKFRIVDGVLSPVTSGSMRHKLELECVCACKILVFGIRPAVLRLDATQVTEKVL